MAMSLTVYTCVLGETDPLRAPTVVNPQVRYVCFSDVEQTLAPYEHVRIPLAVDSKLQSRAIKILANHPALGTPDATLWHDAAFRLDCDPLRLATRLLTETNMVAFRHPHRNAIEDEASAIAKFGWIPAATLAAQVAAYRADGFTQRSHITSTGLCFRRQTPALAAFNAFWWAQVEQWGYRDQMSVDYALWKMGIRPQYIPGHYRDNRYARWYSATSAGRATQRGQAHAPRQALSIGYRTIRRS